MEVRQQNETLENLAIRLNAIFQTVVDGIITINRSGIIESVNPAACRLFDYTQEEMVGQNVSFLMPEPDHSNHNTYIHNYQSTGNKKIIDIGREVEGKTKSGEIFPFWLAVSEATLDGKQIFTGIIHDMTKQKEAENSLKKLHEQLEGKIAERTEKLSAVVNKLLSTNQQLNHEIQERRAAEQSLLLLQMELEQALRKEQDLGLLKSRFVSMASHEFRTPLSTILSSASLMDQYTKTEQQDKRHKHYLKIKNNVDVLTMLLNDFLSISRLEEGKVEIYKEKVSLQSFCLDTIDEMKQLLKKDQKIKIDNSVEEMEVETDKKLLKLMLINLISNASKYSEEGTMIYCTLRCDQKKLYISIKDEGMGIPEADQKYMFDRFFRASNATHIKGTGLGLHIVKRYASLLDGTLSFQSTLEKGSTFTITLPL